MSNQLTTFSNVYASSSPPPPIPVSSPIANPTPPDPTYSPKPPFTPPIVFVGDPFDFEADGAIFLPVACLF